MPEIPDAPPGFDYVGPFGGEHYRFTVDGYRVPFIEGNVVRGEETNWNLFLDGRFGVTVSQAEMGRWMPFLAHAMAIAAGYSCFGKCCRPMNPFQVRMVGLGSLDELTEEEAP